MEQHVELHQQEMHPVQSEQAVSRGSANMWKRCEVHMLEDSMEYLCPSLANGQDNVFLPS